MEVFVHSQEKQLASYLPKFRELPLSFRDASRLPQRKLVVCIPLPEPVRTLQEYDLEFLFRYDVFPPRILKFLGEWQMENREMRVGDVIVQQAQVPPISVGLKFIFGVRILSIHRSEKEASFSYGTLQGHPETGTNKFSVYISREALFVAVQTVAAPGLFLSRLLGPVFTRPYVALCNRQALRRMEENLLKHNSHEKLRADSAKNNERG